MSESAELIKIPIVRNYGTQAEDVIGFMAVQKPHVDAMTVLMHGGAELRLGGRFYVNQAGRLELVSVSIDPVPVSPEQSRWLYGRAEYNGQEAPVCRLCDKAVPADRMSDHADECYSDESLRPRPQGRV